MNKKILFLGAFTLLTTAATAMDDYKLSLGLGASSQLSPYKGVGNTSAPLPILDFQYNKFYIKTGDVKNSPLSIGYQVFQNQNIVVSTYVNPWGGYNVDRNEMDKGYDNLDKRSYQTEGGVKALVNTGFNNIMLDLHGTVGEEGAHSGIAAFRAFSVNEKLVIIPKLSATYFTGDYLDYYFGVSENEAERNTGIDSEYKANGGFSFGFDLAANYRYSPDLSFIAFAGVEKLSDEVKDSPIVEEDVLSKVGLAFNYSF